MRPTDPTAIDHLNQLIQDVGTAADANGRVTFINTAITRITPIDPTAAAGLAPIAHNAASGMSTADLVAAIRGLTVNRPTTNPKEKKRGLLGWLLILGAITGALAIASCAGGIITAITMTVFDNDEPVANKLPQPEAAEPIKKEELKLGPSATESIAATAATWPGDNTAIITLPDGAIWTLQNVTNRGGEITFHEGPMALTPVPIFCIMTNTGGEETTTCPKRTKS